VYSLRFLQLGTTVSVVAYNVKYLIFAIEIVNVDCDATVGGR